MYHYYDLYAFYDLYASFDEFYETMFRGNEVLFAFRGTPYFMFPVFNNMGKVFAVRIGKQTEDIDTVCYSKNELLNFKMGDLCLADALNEVYITFYNF